jgi:hypothetical protein
MRLLRATLMALVLLAAGLAPAGAGAEAPPPPPPPGPGGSTLALATRHPVIGRLGVATDLAQKIADLFMASQDQLDEAHGQLVKLVDEKKLEEAAFPDKLAAKKKEIIAERERKIRELLSAELLARYDAGMQIYQESNAKLRKNLEELLAATGQAGVSADKAAELRAKSAEQEKAILKECDRLLDEKVGKLPAPKSSGGGGATPKE